MIYLAIWSSACGSVIHMESPSAEAGHFNRSSQGRYGDIFFLDGKKSVNAYNITLIADSILWIDKSILEQVPISKIDHVSFRTHGPGPVIAGAVGGFFLAWFAGSALINDKLSCDSDGQDCETTWEKPVRLMYAAFAGLVGGGIAGAVVGSRTSYYFNTESYKKIRAK